VSSTNGNFIVMAILAKWKGSPHREDYIPNYILDVPD
jgi:hypothetical protein